MPKRAAAPKKAKDSAANLGFEAKRLAKGKEATTRPSISSLP